MKTLASILFLGWLFLFPTALFAELVADVDEGGVLTLESGKRVSLVGVTFDEEGVSVLRVLVRKKDVNLQLIARPKPVAQEAAYVYLQAKSMPFPFRQGEAPGEQEVLVNELLVKLGAAKVDVSQEFSRKAKFLKIQAEAEKKGLGVWSYEVS